MGWPITHVISTSAKQTHNYPRTPYPYDPVRDGTIVSRRSSIVSLSSGIGSPEMSDIQTPENLVKSPAIIEQDAFQVSSDRFQFSSDRTVVQHYTSEEDLRVLASMSDRITDASWGPGLDFTASNTLALLPPLPPGSSPVHSQESDASSVHSARLLMELSQAVSPQKRECAADTDERECKRPRLENLQTSSSPAGENQHYWAPTPVSPERQFSQVLAEKFTSDGRLFKVMWRDSWVHESKLPDIDGLRGEHILRHGREWKVLDARG